jgi:uncharacterized membrane protein (DUF106 family)
MKIQIKKLKVIIKIIKKKFRKWKKGNKMGGLKKIGSTVSIISMSQASNSSCISKGFLSYKSYIGGQCR